jgi:hypothetical protein
MLSVPLNKGVGVFVHLDTYNGSQSILEANQRMMMIIIKRLKSNADVLYRIVSILCRYGYPPMPPYADA